MQIKVVTFDLIRTSFKREVQDRALFSCIQPSSVFIGGGVISPMSRGELEVEVKFDLAGMLFVKMPNL